jgi:hypothetical protein
MRRSAYGQTIGRAFQSACDLVMTAPVDFLVGISEGKGQQSWRSAPTRATLCARLRSLTAMRMPTTCSCWLRVPPSG